VKVCGAALVVLSAVGCGSKAEPSTRFTSDAGLRAQVREVASQLRVLDTATGGVDVRGLHAKLTDDCVRRHGVAVPQAPPLPTDPGIVRQITDLDLWLNHGQPLGRGTALSDPAQLQKQRGFLKETVEVVNPPYPPEGEKYLEGDPPQLLELPLPGGHGGSVIIPIGGCHGKATETLYGVDAETFERTRMALPRLETVIDEAVADDRVDGRLGAYSDCMKKHDLDVRTPADLQDIVNPVYGAVLEGTQQPARLVALEQRVVAADAACKTSSGLGTAFAEALVERGRAALAKTEGVVVEYRRMMDHAKAVARNTAAAR
jgi:hypothetical protein